MQQQAKLTLRLNKSLINRAKKYSQQHHKSLSRMVAEYFALLEGGNDTSLQDAPPIVQSLIGCLGKSKSVKEDDYHRHLEDKYL